jgi:conjugative transfer signal peptidase TraF
MRRPKVHTVVPICTFVGAALCVTVIVASWREWGPRLLINATRSEPMGFYRLISHEQRDFRRGMTIVFPVPPAFQGMVYGRGWLREGVPFLKTIMGLPGDRVCVDDTHFEVNGRPLGPVYTVDSAGAPMPRIRGCFAIPPGYFFPASTYHPRSFDGRYIGPQPLTVLGGEARALWTF